MTVSPLPLEIMEAQDELVILALVDGTIDATVAHLPVDTRGGTYWNDFKWPPAQWAGRCGAEGWTYNRAGVLEDIEICGACEAAA